jgi:FKBP-type peptidyl-prolyl cis-trans isomerase
MSNNSSPSNTRNNNNNNNNNTSTTSETATTATTNMDSRQASNLSDKLLLDHKVEKYIKHIGAPNSTTPGNSPFSLVTFCARLTGIEIVHQNNNNNNNNNNNKNNNSSDNMVPRYIPLLDSFDVNKPLDVLLGVTRIFKGLEIALRSMSVGERAEFVVPPEVAHFYGGAQLPRNCIIEMDLMLVSCDNATKIPKLPMIDFEPYKIVKAVGGGANTKKATLGSVVDFLFQELDERTGLMSQATKLQIVAGLATNNPLLDMMILSMTEREISTFLLRNSTASSSSSGRNAMGNNQYTAPQQFYITVIKITPSQFIQIPISPSMIMKVYDPQQQQQQDEYFAEQQQQNNNNNNDTNEKSPSSSSSAGMTKSFSDTLVASASLSVVDLSPFSAQGVEGTLQYLQETARKLFEGDFVVPATWFFAAASAVTRQKSTVANAPSPNIAETNKALARLARNMGRCAYRQKRFAEALHLARESYSFDSSDAKGAFLLAQALRENDLLNEARNILGECEKMPDCHSESFEAEKDFLAAKIAEKSSVPTSPSK